MALSTRQRITREVKRLQMCRQLFNDAEIARETEAAHARINELLDRLDTEMLEHSCR